MDKFRISPKVARSRLLFLALVALRYSPPVSLTKDEKLRKKRERSREERARAAYTIDRESLEIRRDLAHENLRPPAIARLYPFDRRRPVLARSSFLPDVRDLVEELNARAPESFPRVSFRRSSTAPGSFEVYPTARVDRKRFDSLLRLALRILRAPAKKIPPRKSLP